MIRVLQTFSWCYLDEKLLVLEIEKRLYTVKTRIKEPTSLGDSLLKNLIGGGSVILTKTYTNCIFITVAFSPVSYFANFLLCGFLMYVWKLYNMSGNL